MVMEDLQHIIPDQVKNISGRKTQILYGGVVAVLLVTCVILGSLLGVARHGNLGNGGPASGNIAGMTEALKKAGVCLTTPCLQAAAEMQSRMNDKINPCDNFYEHACGKWRENTRIPPDRSEVTVFSLMRDENDERLRELMESSVKRKGENSSERKLKEFFQMCLHDYGRLREGGSEVVKMIREGLGGWYALDPSTWTEDWDAQSALTYTMSNLDTEILFRVRLSYVYRTNSTAIWLSPGGLGMYYNDYVHEERAGTRDAYQDYIRAVGVLLLRDANLTLPAVDTNDRVEQFVNDAYGTELRLAQHVKTTRDSRSYYRYARMTINQLTANFSRVPWRVLLPSLFDGANIRGDTVIRVQSPMYFSLLDRMLLNETQYHVMSRMLNNYLVWRVADKYATQLSWEYRAAKYRYSETRYGVREFPPTWQFCLSNIRNRLGALMAGEYIQTHIGDDNRRMVSFMTNNLINATASSTDQWTWMDNATQALAKEKLKGVTKTIGFPKKYMLSSYLDQMHSSLTIDKSQGYFPNLLNVNRFRRRLRTMELQSGADYYMWQWITAHGGFGTRPWLFWRTNHVLVPGGLMHRPFFDRDQPDVFNYASLGAPVASEILKTVGASGRFVWANGTNMNWWSDSAYEEYLKKLNCFYDHYENMKLGPYLVNGENRTVTLEFSGSSSWKTVAMLGGLRIAYRAYKTKQQTDGPERLPLTMTQSSDQIFFTAYAQTQCYLRSEQSAYERATWSYVPEDIILNSIVRHMDEFTQAFSCPVTSKLHALNNNTCDVY